MLRGFRNRKPQHTAAYVLRCEFCGKHPNDCGAVQCQNISSRLDDSFRRGLLSGAGLTATIGFIAIGLYSMAIIPFITSIVFITIEAIVELKEGDKYP